MNMQDHVKYITKLRVQELKSSKLRGVSAQWKSLENTLCLSFYIDGEASGEDLEDFSTTCGEIIASYSSGLLEENYIRWDFPKPLPETEFMAYKRQEEVSK